MSKALGILAGVLVGGGALVALSKSQPSGSVVVPGSKPPPPPKPPPPVPTPPPGPGGVTSLSTFGWVWMPIGQVPTGIVRCAAVATGMTPGSLPKFVEVLQDYWDLRLYAPYTADPDDWPSGPESLVLQQNPYYAQNLQGWQIVHWEGSYHGAATPYMVRASPAQGGYLMVYGCWVKSAHGVA
jgi:hypothetical protein